MVPVQNTESAFDFIPRLVIRESFLHSELSGEESVQLLCEGSTMSQFWTHDSDRSDHCMHVSLALDNTSTSPTQGHTADVF